MIFSSATPAKPTRQIGIRQRSLRRHCRLGRATELVFVLATGATLALGGGQAQAQDINWRGFTPAGPDTVNVDGFHGGSLFVAPGNWVEEVSPAGRDVIIDTDFAAAEINAGTTMVQLDSGDLEVRDTGQLTVTGPNGISITGGELLTLDGGTVTTTTYTQSGGTLSGTVSASGAKTLEGGTISGTLTGSGATTVQTGTTTVSTGSIVGDLTLASGTLQLGNDSAITGTITTNGSVIDYADGIDSAAPIVIASTTTQLQVLTGTATQSGVISEWF